MKTNKNPALQLHHISANPELKIVFRWDHCLKVSLRVSYKVISWKKLFWIVQDSFSCTKIITIIFMQRERWWGKVKAVGGETLRIHTESNPKTHSRLDRSLGSWGQGSAFLVIHVYYRVNIQYTQCVKTIVPVFTVKTPRKCSYKHFLPWQYFLTFRKRMNKIWQHASW